MRSSAALVLVVAASCGRFGYDPLVDATPDAAVLPSVQTGSARIAAVSSIVEASIASVDLQHTVLTFSLSVVDEAPDDIKITGRFLGNDRIEFQRAGTEFPVDIRWSVVTWNRMNVRRGSQSMVAMQEVTALIEPPVDISRSFAIATHRDPDSFFTDDEFVEVSLLGPSQLLAQTRVRNLQTVLLEWQVVELDTASVHHGTAKLPPATTFTEVETPSFDPARAWLIYSHSADGGAPSEAQHQTVSGRIIDGTRIAFERGGGAGTSHISWSLVELATGTVEHGEATFPDGTAMLTAPITPVDPTRSFVFGGSFAGTSGRTTSIDSGPGPAWAVAELADQQLTLQRGISTGTTVAPWSVITLE